MACRKDTITLNFDRGLSRRPLSGELCRWLSDVVNVKVSELRSVEYEFGTLRVFLKMKTGDRIEEILEKDNGARKMRLESGEVTTVVLTSNGHGVKTLRVKNLPTEISDAELRNVLREYGEVSGIEQEKYGPGLLTGVRYVRMAVKKNVPSYVKVAGEEAFVSYFGQKETCHTCGQIGHKRASCPSKMARRGTYASRVGARTNRDEEDDVSLASPQVTFNPRRRSESLVTAFSGQGEGGVGEEDSDEDNLFNQDVDLNDTILEDMGGVVTGTKNKKNLRLNLDEHPAESSADRETWTSLAPTPTSAPSMLQRPKFAFINAAGLGDECSTGADTAAAGGQSTNEMLPAVPAADKERSETPAPHAAPVQDRVQDTTQDPTQDPAKDSPVPAKDSVAPVPKTRSASTGAKPANERPPLHHGNSALGPELRREIQQALQSTRLTRLTARDAKRAARQLGESDSSTGKKSKQQ